MIQARRVLRVGLWLVAGVLGLGLLLAVGTGVWLRRSLPELEGELKAAGLSAPVEVLRDARGVPTLTGATDEDVLFALGYAHAQDRFVQMETQRRLAQGRLSELIGPKALSIDNKMRRFGLYRAAERSVEALLPKTRAAVDAYSAGVNAWVQANTDRLPPELVLLSLKGAKIALEPWRPADSVAILKLLSMLLDGNYTDEKLHGELIEKLGAARAEQLLLPSVDEVPTIMGGPAAPPSRSPSALPPAPAAPAPSHGSVDEPLGEGATRLALEEVLGMGPGVGSNSWVIAGSRTKSGHPLLSNDPHLAVQCPSQWYLARLVGPTLRAVGSTIPGIPAVVIGRTEGVAWGITAMHADVQDLFVERVDPSDPSRYLVGEERKPFVVREETIGVAGQRDPVHLTVRSTEHGPIIEDNWLGRGPLALSWIALAEDDTSLDGLLAGNYATDGKGFREAMRRVVAPMVNFTYADSADHIGYIGPGRMPVRSQGDGMVPLDGSKPGAGWQRYLSFEELPQVVDPPEGFIVSANQQPASASYSHFLGRSFSSANRARRIRELILARDKIGFEDLATMHADVTSVAARKMVPRLLTTPVKGERERQALDLLRQWDFSLRADSAAALLYVSWMITLPRALFLDELGEDALWVGHADMVERALFDPAVAAWCDDQRTPARESCDDILARSLGEAIDRVVARAGSDSHGWRLDRAQSVRFSSRIGGAIPLLGALFTRQRPTWGDISTVRVSRHDDGLQARTIPTLFSDSDLAPGHAMRLTTTMGQSEHPLSPHFDDMLPAWLSTSPPQFWPADPSGAQRLTLKP